MKDDYPELTKLVKIAMTICVSTAECERSFSALKRIKTHLRSTMTETRLADLATISIEWELAKRVNLEDILTEYATLDKNRRLAFS